MMKKWKERGKRIAALLLAAVLIGNSVDLSVVTVKAAEGEKQLMGATTITPTQPANGDGSENNPYQISTAGELYWFAGLVNGTLAGDTPQNTSACAKLTESITINDHLLDYITYEKDSSGNPTGEVENSADFISWTPIGSYIDTIYTGKFDGNNHTISGLFFDDGSTSGAVGLFGRIGSGASVSNVGVVDSYFYGDDSVGGVCGSNDGGIIENCYHTGTVIGNYWYVEGVCGNNCYGTVTNCYHKGTVIGNNDYVGGVCGNNCYGTVEKCYNEGTVIGYTKSVGGVCGLNGSDCKTTNCYNIGAVTGFGGKVGGVCGYNSSTIENCYNAGTVTGAGEYAGGVCGQKYTGTITDCYYLEGTASGGINGADASGSAEVKTTTQFGSGEVAYLLQEKQTAGADGKIPQVWGQNIDNGGERQYHPVFSNVVLYATSEASACKGYSNTEGNIRNNHSFLTSDGTTTNDTEESCSACGVKNINYSGLSVTWPEMAYDGTAHTPVFTIKTGTGADADTLKPDEDYTVEVTGQTNVSATAYTATITGKGDYAGVRTVEWNITPATVTPSVTGTAKKTYDGTTAVTGLTIGLTGVLEADEGKVTATAAFAYKQADAGENIPISVTDIQLDGEGSGNYKLSKTSMEGIAGKITPVTVTPFLVGEATKTYDGTTDVSSLSIALKDLAGTDKDAPDKIRATAKIAYAQADAGENIPISVTDIQLDGTKKGNYVLSTMSLEGITGTIEKAENAPNIPGAVIRPSQSRTTVGTVELPTGWAWSGESKNTALTEGMPVTAGAIYMGADKGNYKNVEKSITIIRANHEHVESAVLFTGVGDKLPTCT